MSPLPSALIFHLLSAVALFGLTMPPVIADPQRSDGAMSKGDLEIRRGGVDPRAADGRETSRLVAGVFIADVSANAPDTPLSPGGSAFAQIILSQQGAEKRDESELVLSADGGSIRSVSGVKLKDRDEPGTFRVRAAEMKKGRPIRVLVEMALDDDPLPRGAVLAPNRLRVTLREPGSEGGESAELSWPVAECTDSYPSAFPGLLEGPAAEMLTALKNSRFEDRGRPGRWLFRPERTLLVKRGRDAEEEDPVRARDREIIRAANVLVRSRTVQRDLLPRQKVGLVSRKIATDLRRYLQQDPSPALCTGVDEMLGYFDGKLDGLREGSEAANKFAITARDLASDRTQAALDLGSQPVQASSEPAETGSVTRGETGNPVLKRHVEALAALGASEKTQQSVRDAPTTFDALRALRKGAKPLLGKSAPEQLREAASSALTMIEAADYLARGRARYMSVRSGIEGSMTAIREAQTAGCGCSRGAQNAR